MKTKKKQFLHCLCNCLYIQLHFHFVGNAHQAQIPTLWKPRASALELVSREWRERLYANSEYIGFSGLFPNAFGIFLWFNLYRFNIQAAFQPKKIAKYCKINQTVNKTVLQLHF